MEEIPGGAEAPSLDETVRERDQHWTMISKDKSWPKRHRENVSHDGDAGASAGGTCAQARGEGEINSGGTCAQSKREGARVGGAVLSSFATTETNEQLKDDEKKRKQPGNGTQEPKKKTVGEWDAKNP